MPSNAEPVNYVVSKTISQTPDCLTDLWCSLGLSVGLNGGSNQWSESSQFSCFQWSGVKNVFPADRGLDQMFTQALIVNTASKWNTAALEHGH